MINSILSPVHILEFEDIGEQQLRKILATVIGKFSPMTVVVIEDSAPIERKEAVLSDLAAHCTLLRRNNVQPNPCCSDIMEMVRSIDFTTVDAVLAIGGGSVMDSAKAAAMLATNGGDLEEYLGNAPDRTISKRSLPLILIPTTAGTGSEVTKVGVYTASSGRKYTLGSPLMLAHCAVLVGSFIDSAPTKLCASTGLDALDHALESIWNINATEITIPAAEDAAKEVLTWLPRLYQAKQEGIVDRHIQLRMLHASCMSGIAFNITGTAAGHAISFILSEDWHVPHGLACAFTLPEVFDIARRDEHISVSLAKISRAFHPDINESEDLVSALKTMIGTMMRQMDIPRTFKELSVSVEPDELSRKFSRAFSDPKMGNQKPRITPDMLDTLLRSKL